jgi:hypothetical protein
MKRKRLSIFNREGDQKQIPENKLPESPKSKLRRAPDSVIWEHKKLEELQLKKEEEVDTDADTDTEEVITEPPSP